MNRKTIGPEEVEEIFKEGQFQPSAGLQRRVKAAIAAPQRRRSFPWPASWSFSRRALATGLSVLLVAALFTGVAVALSTQEKAAGVLDGVNTVYQDHLVHPIGETRQAGDISVTLDWVYADWNQVLVAYTAQGTAGDGQRVEGAVLTAALDDGTALEYGQGGGYAEINTSSSVSSFLLPAADRSLETLRLHLVINTAYSQYPVGLTTGGTDTAPSEASTAVGKAIPGQVTRSGGGDVAFDVEVPVSPGRTFQVGQTVQAAGVDATLEEVTIAPSMTTASLCFQAPDPSHYREWVAVTKLAAGGKEYSGASVATKTLDPTGCVKIQIWDSVPQDQASYTLRVDELVGFKFGPGDSPSPEDHPEEQVRIKGPWVFMVK